MGETSKTHSQKEGKKERRQTKKERNWKFMQTCTYTYTYLLHSVLCETAESVTVTESGENLTRPGKENNIMIHTCVYMKCVYINKVQLHIICSGFGTFLVSDRHISRCFR